MNQYNQIFKLEHQNKNSAKLLELLEIDAVKATAAENKDLFLRWACQYNMPEVALKILELAVVKAKAAEKDNAALIDACQNKMSKVALKLLEIDLVKANAAANNNAAIKAACENSMSEVALKLLEIDVVRENIIIINDPWFKINKILFKIFRYKFNTELEDSFLLEMVCFLNLPEVALKLLELEAVKAHAAANGNTALIDACRNGMSEVALILLEIEIVKANAAVSYNTCFKYACIFKMTEVALKLLEIEVVKAQASVNDNEALRVACHNYMSEVALKLLEIGTVKANAAANNNYFLKCVCLHKMSKVALKLLEIELVKAQAQASNNYALRMACLYDMPEVALKLLEIDAVRTIGATEDNAALRLACLHNMTVVALKLLEINDVKANVAAYHNAALRIVCQNNMPEVTTKLLEIDVVRTAVMSIADADKHHKLLIMACKIHDFEVIQEIFAIPNLALDLAVLQETLPQEFTSDLEWHLALLLMTNPRHPLAKKLSETQLINLQKRLCQDYRNLYHSYLQERLPIELLDIIIVYTKLHPQLKHLSEQDRSIKTLLSVLSRCVLLHQSSSILTGLIESKNEELLQGLLKQAAMQAEIITALDQLAGPKIIGTILNTTEITTWKNLGIDFTTWRNFEDLSAKTAHLESLLAPAQNLAPEKNMLGNNINIHSKKKAYQ